MSRHLETKAQPGRYASPWRLSTRLKMAAWSLTWLFLFRPTPKPMSRWRVLLLRVFGCQVIGRPFVSQSAIIKMPWLLTLEHKSCLGPGCEVYNLAHIRVCEKAVVAQQAYLCAGTHDFNDPVLPLVVGEITIGRDAFVGARAFILPGVTIAEGAVIGACSVVSKDMPAWYICAGNPCKPIKPRNCNSMPGDLGSAS